MEKGYVENGFIVDLANAKKTSEIIYELSRILDMPEAKNKKVCLKLGEVDLNSSELISVKALIETMDSEIELETALDKIFGEGDFEERYPEEDEEPKAKEEQDEIEIVEIEDGFDQEEIKKYNKETEKFPTLYIHRTLRSGQSISSEGNIVIIGDVNPGAEIIAKGDITVWGILGGIAHAGSDGNTYSRIRALKLNAIQIRIGNVFARRPDTVNTPYVQKTDTYTPEEARVHKKHIMIYKLHEA